jgi:hypothetical protein
MATKISKAGVPRKSRRLRLPLASRSGGDRSFLPTAEDWARIEHAYGHSIDPDGRGEIIVLVESYFCFQPAERLAPFADDTQAYLERLARAGKKFWDVLLERESMPMSRRDGQDYIAEEDRICDAGKVYAQSVLGGHLKNSDFRHQTDWRRLLDVIGAFQSAVVKTQDDIKQRAANTGFVEGRQWANLVWKLGEWAKKRKLPVGLTKFEDPAQAAPFVGFVRELQATFDEEFRRHSASNAALTQAITSSWREIKRALADREKDKSAAPSD